MVNEESSSDVVFEVEGRPVFAHRILCYTSPHLAKLIDALSPSYTPGNDDPPTGSPRPSPRSYAKMSIQVTGLVSHKVFVGIMEFIYSGKIPRDADWNQFWHASIKLELTRLQQVS